MIAVGDRPYYSERTWLVLVLCQMGHIYGALQKYFNGSELDQ